MRPYIDLSQMMESSNWRGALRLIVCFLTLFAFALPMGHGPKLLRPAAHFTEQDRDAAIERGLQFIYRIASNPEYFAHWGHDLVFCFYSIANTAKSEKLRATARSMGEERARQWRLDHPDPPTGDADSLYVFVFGAQATEKLLGPDLQLKNRVRVVAGHFSAMDFMGFDARHEPPPADIPERCPTCNYQNARGTRICQRCQTHLSFRDRYDVWMDALVDAYVGDQYGVQLGASYPEVLQWISKMRPYPAPKDEETLDYVTYAVTHLVYTLNDYNQYRLSPKLLPQEFRYLRANISQARRYEDAEILGEFMDTLRAFGEDDSAPEIRGAMNYLLSHQNPDGSWGDMDDTDIYARYHTTWTVIDGLRQYSYRGKRLRIPEMLPPLQGKPGLESIRRK